MSQELPMSSGDSAGMTANDEGQEGPIMTSGGDYGVSERHWSNDPGTDNREEIQLDEPSLPGKVPTLDEQLALCPPPPKRSPQSQDSATSEQSILPELKEPSYIHRNFEEFEKIERGGFGIVMRCKHKIDGNDYAIKRVNINSSDEEEIKEEVRILSILNHDNIVRYFGSWYEETLQEVQYLMIQMELCTISLRSWLEERETFNHEENMELFRQISSALLYLETQNIVHNDLHSANILLRYDHLSSRKCVKIGDFGLAKMRKKISLVISSKEGMKKQRDEGMPDSDFQKLATIFYELFCHPRKPYYMYIEILSDMKAIIPDDMFKGIPDDVKKLVTFARKNEKTKVSDVLELTNNDKDFKFKDYE